jgi:hypothetical protein
MFNVRFLIENTFDIRLFSGKYFIPVVIYDYRRNLISFIISVKVYLPNLFTSISNISIDLFNQRKLFDNASQWGKTQAGCDNPSLQIGRTHGSP